MRDKLRAYFRGHSKCISYQAHLLLGSAGVIINAYAEALASQDLSAICIMDSAWVLQNRHRMRDKTHLKLYHCPV